MNRDADDVWPPAPVRQEGVKALGSSKPPRYAMAFGIASLALTLPGLLLFALDILNEQIMRRAAIFTLIQAMGLFGTALVLLLPALGLCVGIAGWRSLLGKLGIAASIIHYGFVFAVAIMD